VRVFALLGSPEMARRPDFMALAREHDNFLRAYRAQDWVPARAQAAQCAAAAPHLAALYAMYARRLDDLEVSPPGPGWDGVFIATHK